MKQRNELIINNVRHILVKDKHGSCNVCSLRSNCDSGIWCIQLMHGSFFEVKKSLILRLLLFFITKKKIKLMKLKNENNQ